MNFLDKLGKKIGVIEDDVLDEHELEEDIFVKKPTNNTIFSRQQANIIPMPNANSNVRLIVVDAVSFDDSQKIADLLRESRPVVVNFENTPADIKTRMQDFLSGTVYAIKGTLQRVGEHILVCAPNNVTIGQENNKKASSRLKEFSSWDER